MAGAVSSKLIGVLKLTLEQLERTEELGHDSRAMRELRSSILRTIAELEIARLQHSRAAQNGLLIHEAPAAAPSRKGSPHQNECRTPIGFSESCG